MSCQKQSGVNYCESNIKSQRGEKSTTDKWAQLKQRKFGDISEMSQACQFTLATDWHFVMIESWLLLLLLLLMINNDDNDAFRKVNITSHV